MTLLLLPLAPLLGAALVVATRRRPNVAGVMAVGALMGTVVVAAMALLSDAPDVALSWRDGMFVGLTLHGFGRVMAVLVPAIAVPVVAYAAAGEGEEAGPRLLGWLLGFVAAMEILVLAGDFLTLLIGWELVGACSWALIGYRWREIERPRAAAQAFLTTRFGDLGLYLAAAAAFAATGSLEFSALTGAPGPLLNIVAAGVLLAAMAKSGQVPFAPWLFSAMSGPTPASALLHSATMVAAGAYALIRLWPWLEPVGWLGPAMIGVGLATTLSGGVVAAMQSDLKRALAGSTSSQYGLMFIAIGAGSTAAAGAQLITHAAFKSLLFLGAGVAIHAVGAGRLDRLRLGNTLPWAAGMMAVGTLALAAVPPMGGAFSKEAILATATHASPALGIAVLAAGGLTAFYAARLVLLAFGPGEPQDVHRPAAAEIVALGSLALLTLLLSGLWLPGAAEVVENAVATSPMLESERWELPASLASLGLAGLIAVWLRRRDALFSLGMNPDLRERVADWLGIPFFARTVIARPTLRFASMLARFDDRVVDAGVRGAVVVGRTLSGLFSRRGEPVIDGIVEGLADLTNSGAEASAALDDRRVDGTVEGLAGLTVLLGTQSRRLQSGLTHHYYSVVGLGLLVLIAVAVAWR
jgi:NADH-quinone oxidoreductase subunit L